MTSALGSALEGQPGVVVCRGMQGIGKTRLAEAVVEVFGGAGARVAWARGTDEGGAPPFWLWHQVWQSAGIEGGFKDLGDEDLTDRDRFALFAGATEELVAHAADAGLVIVLDDIQRGDAPSLRYLSYLVDNLRSGARVAIVATARTHGRRDLAWEAVAPKLIAHRRTLVIELVGVEGDAVASILVAAGLERPDHEIVSMVTTHTGGNPFYVHELGRMLAERPTEAATALADPSRLPISVVELVRLRVESLEVRTQELLRVAAIAGDDAPISLIASVLGQPDETCIIALDAALSAGLVVPPGAPPTCRFAHGIVANAILAAMSVQDRVRGHAALAMALEARYPSPTDAHLLEIARHAAAAVPAVAPEHAAVACERAAAAALRSLAFEQAESLYRQAREVGDTCLDQISIGRLLLAEAAAAERAGHAANALGCTTAAAAIARSARDAPGFARAALALSCTGNLHRDKTVLGLVTEALASDDLEPALRARLIARHAEALVYLDEPGGTTESDHALRSARTLGDPLVLVDALKARQLALGRPEGLAERVGIAAEMVQLGARRHDPRVELLGRLWTIDVQMERGLLHDAAAELPHLAFVAAKIGGPAPSWHALTTQAAVNQARARFPEAVAAAREGFELLMATGETAAFGAFMALTQTVAHHVGFEHPAGGAGPPGPPPGIEGDARSVLFEQLAPAFVLADTGRLDEAEAAYQSVPPATSWKPVPSLLLVAWAMGIHVTAAIGATDDLRVLRDRLVPWRDRFATGSAGQGNTFGPVALLLGIAAKALGEDDEAVNLLADAAATCEERGAAGFAVEARTCLAETLAHRDAPGDREHLDLIVHRTSTAAARLGMRPFTRRLQALGAVAGPAETPPPSPVQADSVTADHPLSARELEVALLVADGLTNRAIAARLFISERTAENHLLHIRTKLGLNNRSQITRWVGQHLG